MASARLVTGDTSVSLPSGHGLPRTDLGAVAAQAARIADFAHGLGPDLESLEVNPLLIGEDGVEALDALLAFSH